MKSQTNTQNAVIDKLTGLPVVVKENLSNGLFVVKFLGEKTKEEIAATLAGELALRSGDQLGREWVASSAAEIHRKFAPGLRSVATLLSKRMSINPETYSGRKATRSDIDSTRLFGMHSEMLGGTRYNGMVERPSVFNGDALVQYKAYYGLGEEDDAIIHFNKLVANNFVRMVQQLPDLAATRFLHALYDLERNGRIWEEREYTDQAVVSGEDMNAVGFGMIMDISTRGRDVQDESESIRSEFLSRIVSNALWIGESSSKTVSDMIIGEEGYAVSWDLSQKSIYCNRAISSKGFGTSSIKLRKISPIEFIIIENNENGRSWGRIDKESILSVGQRITIVK